MSRLHDDLLQQARALLPKKSHAQPKQASLRRAISTAYYALFHLLISEAVDLVLGTSAPASPRRDVRLRGVLTRTFKHGDMQKAARAFSKEHLPVQLGHGPPGRQGRQIKTTPAMANPSGLKTVAEAFVNLQTARHEADYNLSVRYTFQQAADFVDDAEQAFVMWQTVRSTPEAREFLLALAFWDRLRGPKQG